MVRTQYLIPHKEDSIYLISAILGAVVNLVINILLIPRLDAVGAAIGTICAEIVVWLYQILSVRHELRLRKYLKWQIIFTLTGLVMFLVIRCHGKAGHTDDPAGGLYADCKQRCLTGFFMPSFRPVGAHNLPLI